MWQFRGGRPRELGDYEKKKNHEQNRRPPVLPYGNTEMRIYCQRQRCSPRSVVSGDISLMPIFVVGSLVRQCQIRVRSWKMWVFFFDRYIFRMKFPTGFSYRNLHGFARFRGDSTVLVNFFTAQCTLVQMRGLEIACRPSVCPSVTLVDCDHIGWKSGKLIARPISQSPSLFVAKWRSTYSQGNMGKFGRD